MLASGCRSLPRPLPRSKSSDAVKLAPAATSTWERLPSKVAGLALGAGDRLRLETSGGGGHGDPRERAAAALERDLVQGYVTVDGARGDYGRDD